MRAREVFYRVKSSPTVVATSSRPLEIEEFANRVWVHPASKKLVDQLVRTRISPNQISVTSVFAAAAAGLCFAFLPPALGLATGMTALFVWHVLDGADGDLARRTGRASAIGELVDGVCDHMSQALIYIALAYILQRSIGFLAWPVALVSALSHAAQANAYEAGRKTYCHWVYGAPWMRQRPDMSKSAHGLAIRTYLRVASIFSPNELLVEQAMKRFRSGDSEYSMKARSLYRSTEVLLVKTSGILGSTGRSLAVCVSLIAGTPLWFFLYEILFLNLILVILVEWRRRTNLRAFELLGSLSAELQPSQPCVQTIF